MKCKKIIKITSIYSLILMGIAYFINSLDLSSKVIRYIEFNTQTFSFKDLLSILITILAIGIGAIITVATILISMCDKRVIKLIVKYKKSNQLVKTIKIAIGFGLIGIIILAIVYAQLDFKVLWVRLILLYVAGLSLMISIENSNVLIGIVFRLLSDSFDKDTIRSDIEFIDPDEIKDKD